jgi:hypothetical protein
MQDKRKKRERKRDKGKEKGKKEKEKAKIRSKRVKEVQNREELRTNKHDRSRKTTSQEGEKYHFQKGPRGIHIAFGPKYRSCVKDRICGAR